MSKIAISIFKNTAPHTVLFSLNDSANGGIPENLDRIIGQVDVSVNEVFSFMTFTAESCLLWLAKKCPADYEVARIAIPSSVSDSKSVQQAFESVKRILKQDENASFDPLKEVFDKDYEPTSPKVAFCASVIDGKYAFREIDEIHLLTDILDLSCQPYYAPYSAIFLVDEKNPIHFVNGADFDDLTERYEEAPACGFSAKEQPALTQNQEQHVQENQPEKKQTEPDVKETEENRRQESVIPLPSLNLPKSVPEGIPLGIVIRVTYGGAHVSYQKNATEWINLVSSDARTSLSNVTGLVVGSDNYILYLSFLDSGMVMSLAKNISGRGGDNMVAQLFVPAAVEIGGKELESILDYLKEVLSNPAYSTSDAMETVLNPVFNVKYPQKQICPSYKASPRTAHFAVRYYGKQPDCALSQILECRYQDIYADYEAVFLCEKDSPVDVLPQISSADNLSNKPLIKKVVFNPPTPKELQNGVSILRDGVSFSSPVLVDEKSTQNMELMRKGFDSIYFSVKIASEDQKCQLPADKWKKKISFSDFRVQDEEDRHPLTNCRIDLNGNNKLSLYSGCEPVSVDESICKSCMVHVSADNYEDKEEKVNLTQLPDKPIVMKKSQNQFKGTINLANGEVADIVLTSKGLDNKGRLLVEKEEGNGKTKTRSRVSMNVSPLKFYKKQGDCLSYSTLNVWLERIAYLVAGVILSSIVWCVSEGVLGSDESVEVIDTVGGTRDSAKTNTIKRDSDSIKVNKKDTAKTKNGNAPKVNPATKKVDKNAAVKPAPAQTAKPAPDADKNAVKPSPKEKPDVKPGKDAASKENKATDKPAEKKK